MRTIIAGAVSGFVFGIGILVSGMSNPAKVLNFFDLAGTWDPSLAFVMAAGLAVTLVGYRLVFTHSRPAYEPAFDLPSRRDIDAPLVFGAATFGVGWGIAGFCPGGLIPVLGIGRAEPWIFFAALLCGIITARFLIANRLRHAPDPVPGSH